MMRRRLLNILLIFTLIFFVNSPAVAQSYYFELPKFTVDAYWESDGTLTVDYTYYFDNTPSGHIIEYVDVGMPNSNYSDSNITAYVNGNQVFNISSSDFQGEGTDGVAVGLGQYSVQPGFSGTFRIVVENISDVLYKDSQDSNYASAVLSGIFYQHHPGSQITIYHHFPPIETRTNQDGRALMVST
jgi:hypothetical protein